MDLKIYNKSLKKSVMKLCLSFTGIFIKVLGAIISTFRSRLISIILNALRQKCLMLGSQIWGFQFRTKVKLSVVLTKDAAW